MPKADQNIVLLTSITPCHSLAYPLIGFFSVTKNTLTLCCYCTFVSSLYDKAQRGVQSTVSILIYFYQIFIYCIVSVKTTQ